MCGRFSLTTSMEVLEEKFSIRKRFVMKPRYNIAPTQIIPIFKVLHEVEFCQWGFVGNHTRQGIINARAETLHEKPLFQKSLAHKRCLILADGFFEWKTVGNIKQPYYVRHPDHAPFLMAGIWNAETCVIITIAAKGILCSLHERMPLVLPEQHYGLWLDHSKSLPHCILPLLRTCDAPEHWKIYPVSKRMNYAGFDQPECLQSLH